jgi:hypothetical protein
MAVLINQQHLIRDHHALPTIGAPGATGHAINDAFITLSARKDAFIAVGLTSAIG